MLALISGQTLELYAALLLFAVGTGALLPWSGRWQLLFNFMLIADFAIACHDRASYLESLRWLGMLTAAAIAQCAAIAGDRFRRARDERILKLCESDERLRAEIQERKRTEQRLRERETMLHKVFDATKEECIVTRLSDDRILEVNAEFPPMAIHARKPSGRRNSRSGRIPPSAALTSTKSAPKVWCKTLRRNSAAKTARHTPSWFPAR